VEAVLRELDFPLPEQRSRLSAARDARPTLWAPLRRDPRMLVPFKPCGLTGFGVVVPASRPHGASAAGGMENASDCFGELRPNPQR
jgi:hypothetical protein